MAEVFACYLLLGPGSKLDGNIDPNKETNLPCFINVEAVVVSGDTAERQVTVIPFLIDRFDAAALVCCLFVLAALAGVESVYPMRAIQRRGP